jgi:hypothetical protein
MAKKRPLGKKKKRPLGKKKKRPKGYFSFVFYNMVMFTYCFEVQVTNRQRQDRNHDENRRHCV